MSAEQRRYASRAGEKLHAALERFAIDPNGWVAADLGSHVGGFVDCLLKHGAARVHAVEPGYGVLAYTLRKDARVAVHERTNALHFACPEMCDLVTIDVGWTPQRLILPAARKMLKPGGAIISLVKPHYEASREQLRDGVLMAEHMAAVLETCRGAAAMAGLAIAGEIESPLRGHGGNVEFLWLLRPNAERASRPA